MQIALNESRSRDESDDYLIELIGLRADFPDEAMAAYGEIYSRYWGSMFIIAKGVTKDEDVAADLLSDTFNIIYNKASTFKVGKLNNPENIRLSIQKWMTAIMRNIFYDYYLPEEYKIPPDGDKISESHIIETRSTIKYFDDDYDTFIEELQDFEQNDVKGSRQYDLEDDSENLLRVKGYVEKLPDRDRDIILTFYNYYVPGKYTPATVLNDLVEKWGTTRENIRKILEKFRKAIKEDLQPKIFIRR